MADSGGDGSLSSQVFIAVISSVGSVILIIALVMICAFICLCYNEYRKRRSRMQKNSDRVGLLRSKREDEDIVSDQEGEGEAVAMAGVKLQLSENPKDEPAVAVTPPARRSPILAKNRVYPEPSSSTPPENKRSKKQEKRSTPPEDRRSKKQGKRESGSKRKAKGESTDEEGEDVICTKIDDEVTVDRDTYYTLNAELDDRKDTTQLIQTKKERVRKTRAMELEAKAALLGRPVPYIELLSKSCPLDANAMAVLSVGEIVAQYKSVPTNSVELPDQIAAEKEKNRYRNVLPNPHSAVSLKYTGTEGSTYINANFIRGLHGEANRYIVTQGPTFDTMPDFWRLVWEKDVSIIVMLTNLIESGRHKCVKYWPPANEKTTIVYGKFEVKRVKEEQVPSCYMLSHLSLKNMQTGKKRDVYHFWCIAWPDFGIPKVAEPILKLRNAIESRRGGSSKSIVVHCSAGLGRSGTFIAIDLGIQQCQEEGVVDPLKYLCEMRQDRGGMIQTQDQYTFVHQALAEYIN